MEHIRSVDDYINDIKKQLESAKCNNIENPTVDDIKNLKDFDYIETEGKYFPVIVRKAYTMDVVLGIPTIFWKDDMYEVGDIYTGIIPEVYTAEEALEAVLGFKDEGEV